MSKLCKTEDEAKESVYDYENRKSVTGYNLPTYRKAPDNIHWVVFNEEDKKVLKSIKWKQVDLSSCCE